MVSEIVGKSLDHRMQNMRTSVFDDLVNEDRSDFDQFDDMLTNAGLLPSTTKLSVESDHYMIFPPLWDNKTHFFRYFKGT